MIKAIFYKEWIKTRWIMLLGALVLFGFSGYILMNLTRVIGLKGAQHIWEVMITRDALFIELLRYIPMIFGVVLGIAQFVPEMTRKCFKLTLHLPFDANRMTFLMLSYGVVSLFALFASVLILLGCVMSGFLIAELVRHILLTALVWFLAGILGYLLTAWIVLEPTWKRRILNAIVGGLLLKVLFIQAPGEAYNGFLPFLTIYIILSGSLAFLSVYRFKVGKQD